MQSELRSVGAYLERMGVRDPQLRARVEGGLPWTQPGTAGVLEAGAMVSDIVTGPWRPLNPAAVALLDAAEDGQGAQDSGSDLAPLFLLTDGTGGEAGACGVLTDMHRACFVLREAQARTSVSTLSSYRILADAVWLACQPQRCTGDASKDDVANHLVGKG